MNQVIQASRLGHIQDDNYIKVICSQEQKVAGHRMGHMEIL